MKITIKIPKRAASVLVTKRKKRGEHVTTGKALNTNRMAKYFGFYFHLKAITTTGVIKDWLKQQELLKAVTHKKSLSSLYNYINKCERLGLIKKQETDLKLCTWERCMDKLELGYETAGEHSNITFTEFIYEDHTKIKAAPEYHIEAAEIAEAAHYTLKAIAKKINQNVQLKELLAIKPQRNATTGDAKYLFAKQIESFVTGRAGKLVTSEEDYQLLHSVQACPFRNSVKLQAARKKRKLKSTNCHIAYLKRKLADTGLANVKDISCNSKAKQRANKDFYHAGWDNEKKEPTWSLPTQINVFANVA